MYNKDRKRITQTSENQGAEEKKEVGPLIIPRTYMQEERNGEVRPQGSVQLGILGGKENILTDTLSIFAIKVYKGWRRKAI